jgi:hypothetical protein
MIEIPKVHYKNHHMAEKVMNWVLWGGHESKKKTNMFMNKSDYESQKHHEPSSTDARNKVS